MYEAGVEIGPSIRIGAISHVPERVHPVRVIQVGVEAENLPKCRFAVSEKRLWKPRLFSNPVMTGQGCERSIQGRWAHCDRCIGPRSAGTPWCKTYGGCGRIVCRKGFWVVNLSNNPSLDEGNILACWNFDRNFIVVQPGVGMAAMLN